jgi:hypothetical protein
MPPQEIEMRLAPCGDIIVVVTIRDRPANDQEQNLRQWMEDPPDIARVIDC